MSTSGQSDGPVVPGKLPNKGRGAPRPAEAVEERGPAARNPKGQTSHRAQNRERLQHALDRIRQVAKRDKEAKFTTLWHHVYNVDHLRESYFGLKRTSAPGMDGETWKSYGRDLEANLADLSSRLKRGAYRARPVQRVYIPKPDGRQRPIGIPVLEDKIVQSTVAEVLNAVYETDFLGFSYGFRPGRNQHDALDAINVGIQKGKVSWVLDADIRGFFDAMSHDWTMKFVEHRIADQRVLRHIKKWLNAGVLEDGEWSRMEKGTPQGGSISPLLANIYLHYVLDLWVQQWRERQARGQVVIVRYADDFVVGFQHRTDAERFQQELQQRLAEFGLELHSDKTRLIEFGRFAAENRQRRGQGKPETFDFLGFTHYCSTTRSGRFVVKRCTMRTRIRSKLAEIKVGLRRRLHAPIPVVGNWLGSVLTGHYRYYGVPFNSDALRRFREAIVQLWYRALRRRSQRTSLNWTRMHRLQAAWLPTPRIQHPYPDQRLRVRLKAGAG